MDTVTIYIDRLLVVSYPFSRHYSKKTRTSYVVLVVLFITVAVACYVADQITPNPVHAFLLMLIVYSFIPAVVLALSSVTLIYKLSKRLKHSQNSHRDDVIKPRTRLTS